MNAATFSRSLFFSFLPNESIYGGMWSAIRNLGRFNSIDIHALLWARCCCCCSRCFFNGPIYASVLLIPKKKVKLKKSFTMPSHIYTHTKKNAILIMLIELNEWTKSWSKNVFLFLFTRFHTPHRNGCARIIYFWIWFDMAHGRKSNRDNSKRRRKKWKPRMVFTERYSDVRQDDR